MWAGNAEQDHVALAQPAFHQGRRPVGEPRQRRGVALFVRQRHLKPSVDASSRQKSRFRVGVVQRGQGGTAEVDLGSCSNVVKTRVAPWRLQAGVRREAVALRAGHGKELRVAGLLATRSPGENQQPAAVGRNVRSSSNCGPWRPPQYGQHDHVGVLRRASGGCPGGCGSAPSRVNATSKRRGRHRPRSRWFLLGRSPAVGGWSVQT